jgi:hypothetical protein
METRMSTVKVIVRKTKGGPGSGNWGHSGRPGMHGGSSPGGGKGSSVGEAAANSPKLKYAGKWYYDKGTPRKDAGGNVIVFDSYTVDFHKGGNSIDLQVTGSTVNGERYGGYSAKYKVSSSLGYRTTTPGYSKLGDYNTPVDAMKALEKYVDDTYKD